MALRSLLAVPLLVSLVACAGDTSGPAAAEIATVRIEGSRFSEPELVVARGTTVVFVNDDAFAHTVTARHDAPVAFDSGDLGRGDSFRVAVDEPGTYAYFCEIHPTMRAVVTVG